MPLASGTRIGTYEISSALGAGGMGEVYRARDSKLGRDVAIKVLPAALANDADYLARFQREAQVLASLNHSNIAAIYGLEDNAIVMELVEGETLSGPLPLTQALQIAKQIAEALEAAHERGIVHRDLKPANVKITPEGVVKVLDFGLAKAVEPVARSAVADSPTMTIHATNAGIILGTAGYMSPEQAAGKPVDKRADIWSFGVVLWEMLTGKPVFEGETVSHTLAHVLTREINLDEAPPAVRPLLRRCLDRNVKTRLRDIGEARIEIDKLLNGGPAAQQPLPAPSRRPNWWLGILGALVGAAIAIGAVWSFRPVTERQAFEFEIAPPGAGTLGRPLLSPDGRKLIVSHFGAAAVSGFYLRMLDSAELRQVPGPDGDFISAFWSPDSRRIGFFADEKLKITDLDGGPPQILCDASRLGTGAWSSSGVILFTQRTGPLLKVADTGGIPSVALPLDADRGETVHQFPTFLPDGKRFLYYSVAEKKPGLYLAEVDRGKPQFVMDGINRAIYMPVSGQNPGYLMYSRQGSQVFAQRFDTSNAKFIGSEMLVASNVAGGLSSGWSVSPNAFAYINRSTAARVSRIAWMSRKGETLEKVSAHNEDYRDIRLAPDGKYIAYSLWESSGNIWLLDFARKNGRTRLSFGARVERSPVWSPDGSHIAYASITPDKNRIYRRAANGTGKEDVLLESKDQVMPASWSPDGKWLLYLSGTPGHWDQYILPIGSSGKSIPFLIDPYDKYDGAFSPDGRWIAYSSNESGIREVYVQPVPEAAGGPAGLQGKWQISNGGGVHARWRKDGKEIFFAGMPSRIMAAPVVSGERSFQHSSPVPLFPIDGIFNPSSLYDVTADGTKFLVLDRSSGHSGVTVVVNWESRLK